MADDLQPTPTPILDLSAPLPPSRDRSYSWLEKLGIFTVFVSGIAVPFVSLRWIRVAAQGEYIGDLGFLISLVFLGIPVIWLFLTAVHEMGHLIVGLTLGFHFEALDVGPVRLEYGKDGFRLRSARPFRLIGGGSTQMALDRIHQVRKRLIFLYLGGPAATLSLWIVTLRILMKADNPPVFIGAVCLLCCITLHLLTSLLPTYLSSNWENWNDTMFLSALVRANADGRRLIAGAGLQMVKRRGLDDIALNPRWLRMSYDAKYWKEWADYTMAEEGIKATYLERWLAESGRYRSEDREELLIEAAFLTAWYRRNATNAALWLQRVPPPRLNGYTGLRARISLCCCQNQYEEALSLWEKGLKLLQGYPQPWVRRYEESWRLWRAELEQRQTGISQSATVPAN